MPQCLGIADRQEAEENLKLVDKLFDEQLPVQVLELENGTMTWHHLVDDAELSGYISAMPKVPFRAFFIQTKREQTASLKFNDFPNPQTLRILRDEAGLSDIIVARASETADWTRLGESLSMHHDEKGTPVSVDMCYEYGWISDDANTGPCYSQSTTTFTSTTYFLINYPPSARSRFTKHFAESKDHSPASYYSLFDILATDTSLKLLRKKIMRLHQGLKSHEFGEFEGDMVAATRELHHLSRTLLTFLGALSDIEALGKFLVKSSETIVEAARKAGLADATLEINHRRVCDTIRYLLACCATYRRWVNSYKERATVQVNLLLHLANQAESRANLQIAARNKDIAELTAKIAERTQADSAAMITIAAVTLFFLPGAFLSSIFSTVFFNADERHFAVSARWWILPVTIVPLTGLVFLVWFVWLKVRLSGDFKVIKAVKGV